MKVSTDELREAFRIIEYVPVNVVLDSSQFVRLKQLPDRLVLSMTGSLWARAHVTVTGDSPNWTAYFDRRLLKTFLSTARRPEIEMIYSSDKLILRCGQRLEQALHAPITGYERWEPDTTFVLTDDQTAMLKTAVKFLPVLAGAENLEAILFTPKHIIVTDTMIMMCVLGSVVKEQFFLPPEVSRFLVGYGGAAKIAADDKGTGAALRSGFVYQPRAATLDSYPVDKCSAWIDDGVKTPVLIKVKAGKFLNALRTSGSFVLDKTEAVTISTATTGLQISVDTNTGIFRHPIATSMNKLTEAVKLPARKILPWFEFVAGIDDEGVLEYGKLPNASVFRFTDDPRKHILLVADL